MIPMEEAQEAALKAADIEAADADISATTLSEVAGVACYKVEFTSGEYAYAYTINAETGAVMEMSSQEQNAQASGTQTETADPAAPAPAQNATGTGTVDEAAAQKIALEHAGVKAADATITKSKLDYEDGHPEYMTLNGMQAVPSMTMRLRQTPERSSAPHMKKKRWEQTAGTLRSVRQMQRKQPLTV